MSTDRREKLLVDELKDAVGEEAVEGADLDIERAIARQPSGLAGAFQSSRLLLLVVGGALLVTGVIASLATGSWVFFGLALLAHLLISVAVIGTAAALTTETEKPSATAEAELQEEGVSDPSRALNDLVEQVAGEEEGSRSRRVVSERADETDSHQSDRANSIARQQASITPTSENTRAADKRD